MVRSVNVANGVVFWDFDGTLAVRDGLWSGALLDALRVVKPSTALTREQLRPYLGTGFPWHAPNQVRVPQSPEQWWASLRPVIIGAYVGAGLDLRQAESAADHVATQFYRLDAWTVVDGAPTALKVTKDAGYRNVILSNHPPELPGLIYALGLGALVDDTITSAAVGAEKPHPAIFEHAMAAEHVTVDDGVWMIGDNPIADIQGARAVGIRAILTDAIYADSIGTTVLAAAQSIADSSIRVRIATARDIPQIARVHVESWRETYRGLMTDSVLDDPEFVVRRERFWMAALTDPRYAANRIAIAERGDSVVGIAMAGPPNEPDVEWDAQLFVLYTSAAVHGLGAGAALLDAVTERSATVGLWVADPNPRAQAFYRKSGFAPDGDRRSQDGVDEARWVRSR